MCILLLRPSADVHRTIWHRQRCSKPGNRGQRLSSVSNDRLHGLAVDDFSWISGDFHHDLHHWNVRTQENDGISIFGVCRLCDDADGHYKVRKLNISIAVNRILMMFPFPYFQSNRTNYDTVHGTWCDCRPISSGLCLYTRSISNGIEIGWRRRMFGLGAVRCNGDSIYCSGEFFLMNIS